MKMVNSSSNCCSVAFGTLLLSTLFTAVLGLPIPYAVCDDESPCPYPNQMCSRGFCVDAGGSVDNTNSAIVEDSAPTSYELEVDADMDANDELVEEEKEVYYAGQYESEYYGDDDDYDEDEEEEESERDEEGQTEEDYEDDQFVAEAGSEEEDDNEPGNDEDDQRYYTATEYRRKRSVGRNNHKRKTRMIVYDTDEPDVSEMEEDVSNDQYEDRSAMDDAAMLPFGQDGPYADEFVEEEFDRRDEDNGEEFNEELENDEELEYEEDEEFNDEFENDEELEDEASQLPQQEEFMEYNFNDMDEADNEDSSEFNDSNDEDSNDEEYQSERYRRHTRQRRSHLGAGRRRGGVRSYYGQRQQPFRYSRTKQRPFQKPSTVMNPKPIPVMTTEKPTMMMTEKPTMMMTEKPTIMMTEKPTMMMTEKPTTMMAEKPTMMMAEKPVMMAEKPVMMAEKTTMMMSEKPMPPKMMENIPSVINKGSMVPNRMPEAAMKNKFPKVAIAYEAPAILTVAPKRIERPSAIPLRPFGNPNSIRPALPSAGIQPATRPYARPVPPAAFYDNSPYNWQGSVVNRRPFVPNQQYFDYRPYYPYQRLPMQSDRMNKMSNEKDIMMGKMSNKESRKNMRNNKAQPPKEKNNLREKVSMLKKEIASLQMKFKMTKNRPKENMELRKKIQKLLRAMYNMRRADQRLTQEGPKDKMAPSSKTVPLTYRQRNNIKRQIRMLQSQIRQLGVKISESKGRKRYQFISRRNSLKRILMKSMKILQEGQANSVRTNPETTSVEDMKKGESMPEDMSMNDGMGMENMKGKDLMQKDMDMEDGMGMEDNEMENMEGKDSMQKDMPMNDMGEDNSMQRDMGNSDMEDNEMKDDVVGMNEKNSMQKDMPMEDMEDTSDTENMGDSNMEDMLTEDNEMEDDMQEDSIQEDMLMKYTSDIENMVDTDAEDILTEDNEIEDYIQDDTASDTMDDSTISNREEVAYDQDSIGNEDLREGPMDDQMGPSITETREEEGPMMEDDKMYPELKGDMKNDGQQDKEMSRDDEDYQMYGGDTIDSADGTVGMATVSCVTVVTLLSAVLWMIV